ncbi:MAG: aspartate-semialdehyde dehydrogenase [Synergistaceae bacterium]|jgi:aspartate-semialdehyde dehydrogenase|nr:aspartate-semialdehyde dehydrogenase [Synergistaceae bacterium]
MSDLLKRPMKVAVLGVTGLVGREIVKVLEQRSFPVSEFIPLASEHSAGTTVEFRGESYVVTVVNDTSFNDVDLAFFSTGGSISKRWAPAAVNAGAVVIDNSAAWRMNSAVPLVVPEVNPDDIRRHKGIIANPGCSTVQSVLPLYALHKAAGLKYVSYSTYLSVSGTGNEAVEALATGSRALLSGEKPPKDLVYPHPIAFDLLPHIGAFDQDGFTDEEWKLVRESQKVMHLPDLKVSCTAVRVPVFRGHGASIVASFERNISPDEAKEILTGAPGVKIMDIPGDSVYPRPRYCEGKDPVYVGRIRADTGIDGAIAMWVVGDNLRKGAALNTVQIAELLS